MSLRLKDASKGGNSSPAPAGNHAARCFSVLGLGTHTEDGQYGLKTNYKVRIAWELPEETKIFDEKKGPEPYVVAVTYNFVMGDKARIIKDLQSWRGAPFTPEELESFELKNLVGKCCMVQVVHKPGNNGQIYANVDAVTQMPKKMREVMPKQHNPSVYYDISMGQDATFKALPEFLRKQILGCNEWKHEGDFSQDSSDEPPANYPDPDSEDLDKAIPKGSPKKEEDTGF